MSRLSEMALEWASKYPEQDRETVSMIYAMGGLRVLNTIEELLKSQQNLISQIAWKRIEESIKELKS